MIRHTQVLSELRTNLLVQYDSLVESGETAKRARPARKLTAHEAAALSLKAAKKRPTTSDLVAVVSPAQLGKMWEDTLHCLLKRAGHVVIPHGCSKCDLVSTSRNSRSKLHFEGKSRRWRRDHKWVNVSGISPDAFTHLTVLLADADTPAKDWTVLFLTRRQYKRLGYRSNHLTKEQVNLSSERVAALVKAGQAHTMGGFAAVLNAL